MKITGFHLKRVTINTISSDKINKLLGIPCVEKRMSASVTILPAGCLARLDRISVVAPWLAAKGWQDTEHLPKGWKQ